MIKPLLITAIVKTSLKSFSSKSSNLIDRFSLQDHLFIKLSIFLIKKFMKEIIKEKMILLIEIFLKKSYFLYY